MNYLSELEKNALRRYAVLKRDKLIIERNKILNNPLRYYLPCYRRKLKRIDLHLDRLGGIIGGENEG